MEEANMTEACKTYEQEIVLYYYGESSGTAKTQLEKHLEACGSCGAFLESLHATLPLTSETDSPPPEFWQDYSRELKVKLSNVSPRPVWREWLASLFRPLPVPAFAAALVVIIALGFAFPRWMNFIGFGGQEKEILPMAQNLDFYRSIDILDSLDVLEASDGGNRHQSL